MDKRTEISAIVLQEAKRQYYAEEIDSAEYEEILYLIYDRLTEVENNLLRKDYLLNKISNIKFKLNLKDTINFSLSLN